MSCHATLRYATPHHAAPRHAVPRFDMCDVPCHANSRHATPRHATPCQFTSLHATPRHATPSRSKQTHTPLPLNVANRCSSVKRTSRAGAVANVSANDVASSSTVAGPPPLPPFCSPQVVWSGVVWCAQDVWWISEALTRALLINRTACGGQFNRSEGGTGKRAHRMRSRCHQRQTVTGAARQHAQRTTTSQVTRKV
jgi:hypothetical protein